MTAILVVVETVEERYVISFTVLVVVILIIKAKGTSSAYRSGRKSYIAAYNLSFRMYGSVKYTTKYALPAKQIGTAKI